MKVSIVSIVSIVSSGLALLASLLILTLMLILSAITNDELRDELNYTISVLAETQNDLTLYKGIVEEELKQP